MSEPEEIILRGFAVFKFIRYIVSRQDQYKLFDDLLRSDVYITTKETGTSMILIPKCNCEECSAAKEIMKLYAHDKITREQLEDQLESYVESVSEHF